MKRRAARRRGNPGDGIAAGRILHYSLPGAFAEIVVDEMMMTCFFTGRSSPNSCCFKTRHDHRPATRDAHGRRAARTAIYHVNRHG